MTIIAIMSGLGFPSVFACLLYIAKLVKQAYTDSALLKSSVQTLQRDRLLQAYKHHMAAGWIDMDDLQSWEALYQTYHKLGANGVLDAKREQLLQLPNVPPTN